MKSNEKSADWKARISSAKGAIQELHDAEAELRVVYDAALKQRRETASMPGPRGEAIQNLREFIKGRRKRWCEENGFSLVRRLAPAPQEQVDGTVLNPQPNLPGHWDNPVSLEELLVAFSDLLLPQIEALVASADYKEGPAHEHRSAALAAIDARIHELEEQHTDLVDFSASLDPPVVLELLPAVRTRREDERLRVLREDKLQEELRQAREAADAPVRTRRSAASSPYLDREHAGRE